MRSLKEEVFIRGYKGARICVSSWKIKRRPHGVILIIHGMGEHSRRYEHFAHYLNKLGYTVYAHDHRKHGKSLTRHQKLGIFTKNDSWEAMVQDIHIVLKYIQKRERNLPIILLGHSMGSILCKSSLKHFPKGIKGAILTGTPTPMLLLCRLGFVLSSIIGRIQPTHRSKFLNYLTVGRYNLFVKNTTTEFDWLSTDQHEVKSFKEDPFCGFVYNPLFYSQFIKGILQSIKEKTKIPNIPILFITGALDPVNQKSKGVKKLVSQYKQLGNSEKISLSLIPSARHEIFSEKNRKYAYKVVAKWLDQF